MLEELSRAAMRVVPGPGLRCTVVLKLPYSVQGTRLDAQIGRSG